MTTTKDGVVVEKVTHDTIYRELGSIEARLDSLERNQSNMAADVKSMLSRLDQAKGGRLAMFGLLGAASVFGGIVTQVINWLRP